MNRNYEYWLSYEGLDEDTRRELESISGDEAEIEARFALPMRFGTAGLRSVMGAGISRMNVYTVGQTTQALANLINATEGSRSVAISYDSRNNSALFAKTAAEVLAGNGIHVYIYGSLHPTPCLSFAVLELGCTAGINITASHNPPEFNGIKCISRDGTECSPDEERRIEDLYESGVPCVEWSKVGRLHHIDGAGDEYVESIVSKVDTELIRKAELTVCVDCANGASAITTPALMGRLGVRAITVNADQQGTFPGHPSEPTEDNLAILKKLVMDTGADLGIAHDGDADRCVFITGSGRYVSGDQALAVLARYLLRKNKGKDVMVTVATSSVVEDVVSSNGGKVEYTAVGSPIVARAMRSGGGIFGGEENGGLIFADHQYCRDGAMGAAVMLECISNIGCLDSQIDSLPRYHTVKTAISCPDELKQALIERLHSMHSDERCNLLDGLRIDYDDGWVLVRPSGTEPKFRIYSESRVQEVAERRSMEFKQEAEGVLEKLKQSAETTSPSSA